MLTQPPTQTQTAPPSLLEYFANLPDPRLDRCKGHNLFDIIAIAILATICGAEHFTEMEEFGREKQVWLKTFLELKNGIPSHDTFARVFARLDPAAFEKQFITWVQAVATATAGEVVAIDGKTARGSADRSTGQRPLHLVNAWATSNRLVLGQLKVDKKSNEITAVPELLQLLDIKGCIVTVDALNTQTRIAAQICDQEADYVMALKGNHPNLQAEVAGIFKAVRQEVSVESVINAEAEPEVIASTSTAISFTESVETGHGRTETRRCWSIAAPTWLIGFSLWCNLRSLILIESIRQINGQVTVELRYYLSSLEPDAKRAGQAVRAHWGVENSLHWMLDVAFKEDDCRVRVGHAPENLALVRKITHNLLQQETTVKRGVKTKRLKAGWSEAYLLKVLNATPGGL